MAMTEDVKRILLGIVLLIIVVFIFNQMFASPECTGLANVTAEQLTAAIDEVASDDFNSWDEDRVPDTQASDYYRSVPIRLCENKYSIGDVKFLFWSTGINAQPAGAAFAGAVPQYIIAFEKFPEAQWWHIWSEDYPFGGGATNTLAAWSVLRFGPTIVKLPAAIAKGTYKLGRNIVEGVISVKLLSKIRSLTIWWDEFLIRIGKRQAVAHTFDDTGFHKQLPNKFKTVRNNMDNLRASEGMSELEANQHLGIVDKKTTTVFVTDEAGRVTKRKVYVVTEKNVKMMRALRDELSPVDRRMFDSTYYVPSPIKRIEKMTQAWRGFKYKVKNGIRMGWLNTRVIKPISEEWTDFKTGANNYLNLNVFSTPEDTLDTQAAIRRWVQENPDSAREMVGNNWKTYENYISEAAGRTVKSSSDMTDAEMFRFFSLYDKEFTGMDFEMILFSRPVADASGALSDVEVTYLQYETRSSMSRALSEEFSKKSTTDLQYINKNWNDIPEETRTKLTLAIAKDHKILPKNVQDGIYQQSWLSIRESMAEAGVTEEIAKAPAARSSRIPPRVQQRFMTKVDQTAVDALGKETGGTDVITGYVLSKRTKTLSDQLLEIRTTGVAKVKEYFDMLKTKLTDGKVNRMMTRFVFVNMGKAGIGPAKYNPFASYGTYSTRRAIEKASTVEGGCTANALCKIEQGAPTSYLLNTTIDVKLWRPDYSIIDRSPVMMQTIMFQNLPLEDPRFYLVSPCFGFAKVWKHDGTVYVTMEKCDAGDAANYCYADRDYIWGKGDVPPASTYLGVWVGTFAACKLEMIPASIVTFGGAEVATTAQCMRTASYATMALVSFDSGVEAAKDGKPDYSASTEDRDANLPADRTWGYWNFYKAADICDLADMIGSFGGSGAAKYAAKKGTKEVTTKAAEKVSKWSGDLCIVPQVLGDASLAWPRVTALTDTFAKNKPMTPELMREYGPTCAFQVGG